MSKLSFFWIAEYNNENVFPQFDLKTGKENLYKDINFEKLIKFGWYPFSAELSRKVPESKYNPILPHYVISLGSNDKLFARRRGHINLVSGKTKFEYLVGTQNYLLVIDEMGNVEIGDELL